jgi:hypothetical protein
MNETESRWRSIVDLVLPHPTRAQVLVLAGEQGWQLPRLVMSGVAFWQIEQIRQEVRQQLGLSTTVLRVLAAHYDDEQHQAAFTFVLENHTSLRQPVDPALWVGRTELNGMTWAVPQQAALLDAYLTEIEQNTVPPQRAPWARPGWFAQAVAWIEARLAELGQPPVAPVEQVRVWSISCILRAPTAGGDIYFKAAADLPLFANEPVVVVGLAQLFPAQVPAPLAWEAERRWMLLADFGRVIADSGTLTDRMEMVARFAQIQVACTGRVDELLALGCHDRRLDRLAHQLVGLIADTEAMRGLDDEEIAQFQALAPTLSSICQTLAEGEIPPTLVHGDLHLNNVAADNGRLLFFDWTDACVTHPFLDLMTVYDEADANAQAQLRDIYLAPWEAFASRDRLLELWSLARPLCDLHQAISYQHILASLEPAARSDFGYAVPSYMRRIIRTLSG